MRTWRTPFELIFSKFKMHNSGEHASKKRTFMVLKTLDLLYALIIPIFICAGCARKETNDESKLIDLKSLGRHEAAYQTNHYPGAWNALLNYRNQLKDWQASGRLGPDYEYNYARVYGRLAVMAESFENTNNASDFFGQSAFWLKQRQIRLNQATTNYSKEIIELWIKIEDGTNTTWRRDLMGSISSNTNGVTRKNE